MIFNHRLFLLVSIALFALKIILIVPIVPEGQTEKQSNLSSSVGLYRSTDFDVHRHWKAVTHKLPMEKWYKETGNSIWTLDYPPLFAYFEAFLSNVVHQLLKDPSSSSINKSKNKSNKQQQQEDDMVLFDVKIRNKHLFSIKNPSRAFRKLLSNLFYDRNLTRLGSPREDVTAKMIRFMRSTVILFGDIPLYVIVLTFFGAREMESSWFAPLLCAHPALFFIDNIHFQYNSLVFALFVSSIFAADQKSPFLAATFYFVLLMFKHLFLCYAPAFGIWGLCVIVTSARKQGIIRGGIATTLRFITVLVLVIGFSLAPLVFREYEVLGRELIDERAKAMNGAPVTEKTLEALKFVNPSVKTVEALKRTVLPMLERLFPFGRGLCHSYWAPNAFPLYNVADRFICKHVMKSRGTAAAVLQAFVTAFRTVVGQGEMKLVSSKTFCDDVSVNTRGLVHLSAATVESDASRQAEKRSQAPSHAVLPQITPLMCAHLVILGFFILTYSFFPPVVFILRKNSNNNANTADSSSNTTANANNNNNNNETNLPKIVKKFFAFAEHVSEDGAFGLLKMCIASGVSFFLFGWHVHEKAILNVIFPIFLFVALHMRTVGSRLLSSTINFAHATTLDFENINLMAGIFVLPLLFTPKENVFKYFYLFAHHFCTQSVIRSYVVSACDPLTGEELPPRMTARFTSIVLHVMVLISFWVDWKANEMFLPLMVFSCVGSVALFGVIGSIRRIMYQ